MRKIKVKSVAILSLALCLSVLCSCANKAASAGDSASAARTAGGNGTAGPSADVEKKHIDAFGTVKAKTVRNINLDFPAVLTKKLVTEGQRVKRGETLFIISASAYDLQVKNESYDLAMARLELKKSGFELERLREDLEIAKQDTEKAGKNLANLKNSLATGTASQDEVYDSRKVLSSEEQKKRAIERSIESLSSGDVSGLDVQRARISILENELRELVGQSKKSYISGNKIVSDVTSGIVFGIDYTEGDYIGNEKKLCSLLDLDSIIVEANIPEEFIKDAKMGSKADIIPSADPSRTYTGTVSRISNLAVENGGETVIPVEITIDGRDGFLLPNFNVDVKIY